MRKTPHVAALATAVLLGLVGLGTVGSPASATPRESASCTPVEKATYKHSFDGPAGTASIELTNGPLCAGSQKFALVSYTTPSAKFSTPQFVLDKSINEFTPASGRKLDFKVEVPECFTQVDFVFDDKIIDPLTDTSDRYNDRKVGSRGAPGNRSTPAPGQPKEAFYNGGSGTCKAEPVVEALPECDGDVILKLINRSTFSQTFEITGDNGFTKTATVAVRQEPATVVVPAADAKNLLVKSRGAELYKGGWTKPENCEVPEVGLPTGGASSDCDGLDFAVKNPENGKDVTVTFTPNNGAPRSVTAAPGETKTVTFPGTKGLVVAVTGDAPALNGEVSWTAPENCGTKEEPSTPASTPPATATAEASPSPSAPADEATPSETVSTTPVAGSDKDDSLPLTGSAAASIAAGAFLLLVVGGVFFFLARRRKVNFTA
ncbi:LPXTG cell wall anchor domain-containing protein [Actinoplanes couchii]|uniref:Gram-positive cocci surface proteins LPxTG domain-containing protein n=1 Tax=Actinoplanes couchii TaxID=403638 RepID=A0ABQ3X5I2_9ACTN|nr:LPXTG cell wall anchor domain-containing protein [Actinoplanes couchii]MDR6325533.1 LPXTG-motif cell wall-anchored protein [Actinoplanes couchii]GID53767.1 hypothetical protein Aco03nite_021710 [Actinoplanes couchii]